MSTEEGVEIAQYLKETKLPDLALKVKSYIEASVDIVDIY